MTQTFDFIVVGGGMMGGPCARHLAEAGHSVALIAAPEPADWGTSQGPFGSHFDAARITRRVASDPDWSLASCRSIARYRDLEVRSGHRIFHQTGAVMAGPTDGPMAGATARFLGIARALPDPPDVLDVDAVRTGLGLTLPEGTRATHEATQGGWMAPRAMRTAQWQLAQTAGAELFAQPAVSRDGTDVTLACGTRLSGGHVVIATGPHAASDGLLPAVPKLKVWARTIAFARLSEAEGARLAAMPSVIWVPEGWDHDLYMLPPVRYPDGRLYLKIGGQVDSPRIRTAAEMATWFHGPGDAEVGARLLAEMQRILPGLTAEATHSGPCAVVWSETGFPYIDTAGPGITVLCGGNGAAAKCGDELGRLGALMATGTEFAGEGYAQDFAAVWA
ncbi:FAD-dependent oxidoreductase [Jannaschia sp. M317]|uniref:FAD-dependent oxidoreductase n=1 Tax=Jannaschia sp. M317 TaxID=2867011 RepID=UPI0021A90395|nr:FAD-dependent oxidoreductase [Jannaschia sp. M317]UWQ18939.1 FAD-dependent oxidoreductase [Jannaschia sp. M317]